RVTGTQAQRGGADVHIVRRGDTLYSIAWQAGVDFRRLAQWNAIVPPYLIKPGQRIAFRPRVRAADVAKQPSRATPTASSQPARAAPTGAGNLPVKSWVWPADGHVTEKFSITRGNKGIDIAGSAGATVRAAAAGKVVYAGTGLRGYGRLIIVKHNDAFLSAYAHNRRMLVEEGQGVSRGQKIAEMGDSGANSVKLHFEIREQGKPIDPLRYLPRI
ncbi:MAG: peptidoglycan DD-metalloendopeptidase family protein, partial [Gammaproteobacteria bacterium]|nr:peptidoglycan DD-metalloendopeptidase family protein [Gammaproteobacteria bacterium]